MERSSISLKVVHLFYYLHHQNQCQEKAHEAYPYGESPQVYFYPGI